MGIATFRRGEFARALTLITTAQESESWLMAGDRKGHGAGVAATVLWEPPAEV